MYNIPVKLILTFVIFYISSFSINWTEGAEEEEEDVDPIKGPESEWLSPEESVLKMKLNDRAIPGIILFRKESRFSTQFLFLQVAKYNGTIWNPPLEHRYTEFKYLRYNSLLMLEDQTGIHKTEITFVPKFVKYSFYKVWYVPEDVVFYLAELNDPSKEIILSHRFSSYKWLTLEEISTYNKKQIYKYDPFQACYEHLQKLKRVQ